MAESLSMELPSFALLARRAPSSQAPVAARQLSLASLTILAIALLGCGDRPSTDPASLLAARLAPAGQPANPGPIEALLANASDDRLVGVVEVARLRPGARADYERADALAAPLRTEYGGSLRLRTRVLGALLGDEVQDEVRVAIYPSVARFVALLQDPRYEQIARIERDAVERKSVLYGFDPIRISEPTGTFRVPELEGLSRDRAREILQERIPPTIREGNVETVLDLVVDDSPDEFFMVNLLEYRDLAVYPDGQYPGSTGIEAANRYNAIVLPALAARRSGVIFFVAVAGVLVGDRPTWQQVGIVRYASAHAIIDMIFDPVAQAGLVHKFASIEATEALYTRGEMFPWP